MLLPCEDSAVQGHIFMGPKGETLNKSPLCINILKYKYIFNKQKRTLNFIKNIHFIIYKILITCF